MDDIILLHTQEGNKTFKRSEMIDNAKQQEADGIKPGYCFYDYKNGKNITPPGWLVYSTYQDGAGVVYKTDKETYIFIRGWQSEFCLV